MSRSYCSSVTIESNKDNCGKNPCGETKYQKLLKDVIKEENETLLAYYGIKQEKGVFFDKKNK